MDKKRFSKDILKLIYALSQSGKRLYGSELNLYLKSYFKEKSTRTYHRWLKYIKELEKYDDSFDYYPYINFNNIGLLRCNVLFHKPISKDLLLLIPHNYWSSIYRDDKIDKVYMNQLLIPPDKYSDLIEICNNLIDLSLINDYTVYRYYKGLFFTSPLHEIIKKDGLIKNSFNIGKENIDQIDFNYSEIKIHKQIIDEPFLIPILFENDKESHSSRRLWKVIKRKLGDSIKLYTTNEKLQKDHIGDYGEKYIQHLLKKMNDDFNIYYEHLRIYYKSIYEIDNILFVSLFMYIGENEILIKEILDRIINKSVFASIYYGLDNDNITIINISIFSTYKNIFNILKEIKENIDKFDIYYGDIDECWEVWDRKHAKFNYIELFDTKKRKWIFEKTKYIEKSKYLHAKINR